MTITAVNGCAGMKPEAPVVATIPGLSGQFKVGQIVELQTGRVVSFDQLIEQIATKDLTFVGEVHENPEHHLIQVQILQALMDCCGALTLAMEFFQRPGQPSLDRYLRGELSESEFLDEVKWNEVWGYPYHFYRPLMLLAKEHGVDVLAINAPPEIVKKVARKGLKSLDASEREKVPQEIDLNNEAHREYLRKAYQLHNHDQLKKFDYFYEAQCVWEDTMAQNLAQYIKENGKKLIVFTGNGHIVNKFGIPDRTIGRVPVSMVTIMPYALSERESIKKQTADYVWLTAGYPHRARMLPKRKKESAKKKE
jgi:uncharacterized iron-regulated protein